MEDIRSTLLCSQCKKDNQYTIPISSIKSESNEIEHKCIKHGILNENNLFHFELDEKIIVNVKECQIHNQNTLCGWCNICGKNLCQICIGEELRKNHDYILFNSLLTENDIDEFVKNKIINLKKFYKEIKIYYVDMKKYEKEIKLLNNIIKLNEFYYNLFFKKELLNYHIILGLKNNMKALSDNYEKYEKMYNFKYNIFLSFIKGKDIDELNQIKVQIPKIDEISEVLIFNSELFDEINEVNNTINNYNAVIFLISKANKTILVYNMEGKLLNTLSLGNEKILSSFFIQYKSNILLNFYRESNLKHYFSFYVFSSDFKNYELIDKINISKIISQNIDSNQYNFNNDIPIFSFNNRGKMLKIENNKIIILYSFEIYVIKINDSLIFKNKKYYKDNNINKDYNINENIILIHKFKYYLDIIPIYNINNNGILNYILLQFDSELSQADEKLLYQKSINIINKQDVTIISQSEYINKKYYIKLKNFTSKKNEYFKHDNFFDYYNSKANWNVEVLTIIKRIKIYSKLAKYNKEFECLNNYKCQLTSNDTLNLLKIKNAYCDLIYSYEKNYILLLINNSIYQINNNNGELITIFELDICFENDNNLSQYYLLRKIHYYNKDLRAIKELLLFINTVSKNNIFPYFLDCHEYKQMKPFFLPNFRNIFEINFFESSQNALKDSLNMERIIIDTDGIIIFK